MSDPFRLFYEGPTLRSRRARLPEAAAIIIRDDPLHYSARLIARHELRVWFEPDWQAARVLARRFPRCLICSIPDESNTINLHRVPGWRKPPDRGARL